MNFLQVQEKPWLPASAGTGPVQTQLQGLLCWRPFLSSLDGQRAPTRLCVFTALRIWKHCPIHCSPTNCSLSNCCVPGAVLGAGNTEMTRQSPAVQMYSACLLVVAPGRLSTPRGPRPSLGLSPGVQQVLSSGWVTPRALRATLCYPYLHWTLTHLRNKLVNLICIIKYSIS